MARERWPLLGHVRPGERYVPPKAGSSAADRPVAAASWPPLAIAPTLDLLPSGQPLAEPVRPGSVASAEAVAALIHSARVDRPALDALTLPPVTRKDTTANEDSIGNVEFVAAAAAAAAVAAAAPAGPEIGPDASAMVPVAETAVPEMPAAITPATQTPATTVAPAPAPAAPATAAAVDPAQARPPTPPPRVVTPIAPAPAANTSLHDVFARLAQAPRSAADPKTDSTPRKTTQK
ncbi:hypothetical protein C7R54_17020 [Achromobacter aloeverae]|uniref:Uncharacterized protein n=2 Tax=Achromobacter aloeverae TaxID=1750518 RepID=A0A4Q1HGT8_9BURK|nr:hypothetical protein C7R54_17020 [Achromobacter aloeverae]